MRNRHMPNRIHDLNNGEIEAYRQANPNPTSLLPGLVSSKYNLTRPTFKRYGV